jgi:hypothetical protein
VRCGGVDDQHALAGAVLARDGDVGAGRGVRGEHLAPALQEFLLVDDLKALGATAGRVGARSHAFEVHHHGGRLVQHAQPGLAHLHRKVGVFVIGRCVVRIEAAEGVEQVLADRDRSPRAVVHLAHEVVARVGGVVEAPVVPARRVGEHDATGFLQTAVGIHQLGAGQAHVLMLYECGEQRIQPARLHRGIVVEEDQELAARQRRARIAGADEAEVLRIAVVAQARQGRESFRGFVGRAVVHHDDFERRGIATGRQRLQAGAGVVEMVVDRHDHAGARCVDLGQHRQRIDVRRRQDKRRAGLRWAELLPDAVHRAAEAAGLHAALQAVSHRRHAARLESQTCRQGAKAAPQPAQGTGQAPGTAGEDLRQLRFDAFARLRGLLAFALCVGLKPLLLGDHEFLEALGFGQKRMRPLAAGLDFAVEFGVALFQGVGFRLRGLGPAGAFSRELLLRQGPVGAAVQFLLLRREASKRLRQRRTLLGQVGFVPRAARIRVQMD